MTSKLEQLLLKVEAEHLDDESFIILNLEASKHLQAHGGAGGGPNLECAANNQCHSNGSCAGNTNCFQNEVCVGMENTTCVPPQVPDPSCYFA